MLGEGGSGIVFRANDLRLLRHVALKVLKRDPQANHAGWTRLLREARAISRLNHPCFCTIYDVAEDQGLFYIAMEFAEGRGLRDLISGGGLTKEHALLYGAQIAAALAHAHERGVIHRDVKSSNIIVKPSGVVKLLDFGLALRRHRVRLDKEELSSTSQDDPGKAGGTLAYAAPEVLRGERATVQSDIWAVGALLYEMATGKLPFTGRTCFETSLAIMVYPYQPLPRETDPRLARVIRQCLEKDCAHRYAAAQEVHDDLEKILLTLSRAPVKKFAHFWSVGGNT
jgi:serine/threonine protein kinase